MNLEGKKFIEETRAEYSNLPPQYKRQFDYSDISERAARCGREVALYQPLFHWPDDTVEIDAIALATLQKDCIEQLNCKYCGVKKITGKFKGTVCADLIKFNGEVSAWWCPNKSCPSLMTK